MKLLTVTLGFVLFGLLASLFFPHSGFEYNLWASALYNFSHETLNLQEKGCVKKQ